MMQSSAERASTRGYTLLEVLLVLGLITALLGVAAARMTGGSDRLALDRVGAGAIEGGVRTRLRSLASGDVLELEIPAHEGIEPIACTDPAPLARPAILFFPDGHAGGGPLCFRAGTRRLTLNVDWLTGLISADIE